MAYSRIFIALKKGCEGYEKDVREPAGRSIIEVRNGAGRITLQVQGLKSDCDYRVCMLTDRSYAQVEPHLYIGGLGRGEIRWNFDPENLGINVADVKAVAVLSGDKAPLIGFTEGEYNWQKCLMHIQDKNLGNSAENNADDTDESHRSDVEAVSYDDGECDKEKLIHIINEFEKDVDEINKYAAADMPDSVKYIFERDSVMPFEEDERQWVYVNIRELSAVRGLWKFMNDPFVIKGYYDYRHLILGRKGNEYYLGVPCKYESEYKTDAYAQAFNECKGAGSGEPVRGKLCYYIHKC